MKVMALSLAHFAFMVLFVSGVEVPGLLLKGLSSEDFKEREKSQAVMLEWAGRAGAVASSAIYELSEKSDDPEVRERCSQVLKSLSDQDYLADGQGYLGIEMLEEMADVPGDAKQRACIRITRVVADSPANLSGLRPNDLITSLNGKKWYKAGSIDEFTGEIADSKPRNKVVLTIKRGNEDMFDLTVPLGKRPVEDLRGVGEDLQLLDQRAREAHFKEWLKKVKKGD